MSWIPGSTKRSNISADAAFQYWQYSAHCYWLLEEIDGYEFGGVRWWP